MGGRSRSSTSQTSNITDQRAGASTQTGIAVATGGGGRTTVTVQDVSADVVDAAVRGIAGVAEKTVDEALSALSTGNRKAFDFAGDVSAKGMRLIGDVIGETQKTSGKAFDFSGRAQDRALKTVETTNRQAFDFGAESLAVAQGTQKQAFAFADKRAKGARTIQAEALRLVDAVLKTERAPGSETTRLALMATVAVVGLAVAAPAIFKS